MLRLRFEIAGSNAKRLMVELLCTVNRLSPWGGCYGNDAMLLRNDFAENGLIESERNGLANWYVSIKRSIKTLDLCLL